MRSPQCYVSPTEKYSHAEKDAVLWVEVLLYWCCTDKGNTHTHLQTCTKGAALCPLGFFCFFHINGILRAVFIFFSNRKTRAHSVKTIRTAWRLYHIHIESFEFACQNFISCNISKRWANTASVYHSSTLSIIWSPTTELLRTHTQHTFRLILNNITCLTAIQEYCVHTRPAASGYSDWKQTWMFEGRKNLPNSSTRVMFQCIENTKQSSSRSLPLRLSLSRIPDISPFANIWPYMAAADEVSLHSMAPGYNVREHISMVTFYKQLFREWPLPYAQWMYTPAHAHKDPAHHCRIFITRRTTIISQLLKRGIPPRARWFTAPAWRCV